MADPKGGDGKAPPPERKRPAWALSDADLAELEIDADRPPLWTVKLFRVIDGLAHDVGQLKAALAPDMRDNVVHRLERTESDLRELRVAFDALHAKGRFDLWTGARWVIDSVAKGGGALLVAWLLIQGGTCAPPGPKAPAPAVAPAP
jgi:hypothetical protein